MLLPLLQERQTDMQLPSHLRVTLTGQQLVQGCSPSAGVLWPHIVQPLATVFLRTVVAAPPAPTTPMSFVLMHQVMGAFVCFLFDLYFVE